MLLILNKYVVWCIKFLAGIAMLCMWAKQDVVLKPENRDMLMQLRLLAPKKSALNQHVMNFDHGILLDNIKILKSESHAYKRHVSESFLINQKAFSCNVIN